MSNKQIKTRNGSSISSRSASDETLMRMIADRNARAYETLYARHRLAVYRYLMRLVRDESMAEDLVSEVFLEAWRSSGHFEAKSQVLTWLIAIARNKALTELRRRPKIAADERVLTSVEDDADGPILALDKRDRSEIIHDCVGRLSPQHQEIIDLIYYQEKKLHEVAASLGAPINTVKTRIFYARNRMAQLLAEAGVDRTWAAI